MPCMDAGQPAQERESVDPTEDAVHESDERQEGDQHAADVEGEMQAFAGTAAPPHR